MGTLKYKGYTGSVEYSDEDKCLFGKVQGLHGTLISYEGTTIEEITNDFQGAIDDYLEVHEIIKVSLLKTCDIDVREAALDISANTRSEIVQIIGRVIVLYRPSKERVIELPC